MNFNLIMLLILTGAFLLSIPILYFVLRNQFKNKLEDEKQAVTKKAQKFIDDYRSQIESEQLRLEIDREILQKDRNEFDYALNQFSLEKEQFEIERQKLLNRVQEAESKAHKANHQKTKAMAYSERQRRREHKKTMGANS